MEIGWSDDSEKITGSSEQLSSEWTCFRCGFVLLGKNCQETELAQFVLTGVSSMIVASSGL